MPRHVKRSQPCSYMDTLLGGLDAAHRPPRYVQLREDARATAGGRKATVIVEQLSRRMFLFTASEHPAWEAEDIVAKLEA